MHPDGEDTSSMTSFREAEIPASGRIGGNENPVALTRKPTGARQAHARLPGPTDGGVAPQMQQCHLQTGNRLRAQPLIRRRHR